MWGLRTAGVSFAVAVAVLAIDLPGRDRGPREPAALTADAI